MEVEFADENLDRLETDLQFDGGFDKEHRQGFSQSDASYQGGSRRARFLRNEEPAF